MAIVAFALCQGSRTCIAQGLTPVLQDDVIDLKSADGQGLDLEALVKLLAAEENLKIYFDQDDFPKTDKLLFFGEVKLQPGEQFFQFVQLVLRNRGYAIVPSDLEGIHRIVPLSNIRPFVPRRDANDKVELNSGLQNGDYVTAIFSLTHISPDAAEAFLRDFMPAAIAAATDQQNAVENVVTKLPPNILIVTEMAGRIERIKNAIAAIDLPRQQVLTRFIKVDNVEASTLEQQLKSILEQQDSAEQQSGSQPEPGTNELFIEAGSLGLPKVSISSDDRTNRLILIGTMAAIDRVNELILELDKGLNLDVRTFQFEHISAGRIDGLVRRSLPADLENTDRFYQSTINEESNSLIVTARGDILTRIEDLKKQLDVPGSNFKSSSPIEFYKLKHVKATDILETLQRVGQQTRPDLFGNEQGRLQGINTSGGLNTSIGFNNRSGFEPTGPNRLDPNLEGQFQEQPFLRSDPNDPLRRRDAQGLGNRQSNSYDGFSSPEFGDIARLVNQLDSPNNILPGEAQITIDQNTNTLIVVAEPAVQALYKELIAKLDVYRPQVLVEVTVVTLDAQEDFNFGIEISVGGQNGDERLFAFNSFGLSEVNPLNGSLMLIPGLGFNGTLVDPDVASVVLRALTRHRRAKVVSAPRVLVNDNATGLLSSVAEVPFSSINASSTVATTSFAGFAQAGTTVSVTPHISEGEYLNLEFDILVNDFTGAGNESLPPPRNTDQVTSQVSIPDGYTVIVGGLTRQRSSTDVQGIPFFENIPIFQLLNSNNSEGEREQRLFVFIKPIILKDDKFKDLRYLSGIEQREACVEGDFPSSSPVLIR